MAKLSFENYQQVANTAQESSGVGFFTLKNDGDEALVRIMHNSTADFDICTVHPVETPTDKVKFRNVNCIRNSNEPVENCPFCAAGMPLSNRFYIHMLQYTIDDKGQQVIRPVVWERSMAYVYTIKALIDEYGPLSNLIFKIKRQGAAGSRDTKYSILFASPQVYSPDRYPMLPDAFANYVSVGHAVMNKSFQDMMFFLQSGGFPENVATPKQAEAAPVAAAPYIPVPANVPPVYAAPAAAIPVNTPVPQPVQQQFVPYGTQSAPVSTTPVAQPVPQPIPQTNAVPPTFTPGTGTKMPWEDPGQQTGAPVRPNRYY